METTKKLQKMIAVTLGVRRRDYHPPPPAWRPAPRLPDTTQIEPEPGMFRYFADWVQGSLDILVAYSIGDAVGQYHRKSDEIVGLWRWDTDQFECAEWSTLLGRWVESDNYQRQSYLGQGWPMDPVTTAVAMQALAGFGYPEAIDDVTVVPLRTACTLEDGDAVGELFGEVAPTVQPDALRRMLGWGRA